FKLKLSGLISVYDNSEDEKET
ncbi:hypothetical protein SOVF_145100, partial [Spinacia oleracea]